MYSVKFEKVFFKVDGKMILTDISFSLEKGNSVAIIGVSGSGKTMLGKLIAGSSTPTSGEIKRSGNLQSLMIGQQADFLAASHLQTAYYGQRFENLGLDDVPTVAEHLNFLMKKMAMENLESKIAVALENLDAQSLAPKKLMMLSNGERKRVQLAAAILQNPDILVLDQPFVGLDLQARTKLGELIAKLQQDGKTIVVICDSAHIPQSIGKVLELENGHVRQFISADHFRAAFHSDENRPVIKSLPEELVNHHGEYFDLAVKMNRVKVVFRGNQILNEITWTVRKGERWALTGPNGAGKTTLLSLITADNPQGYSNDLVLFDRQRGSGETIWDIKKRIGFVSPELHLYFLRGNGIFNTVPGLDRPVDVRGNTISCADVIASGFHDLIGGTDRDSRLKLKIVQEWMLAMNLNHLSNSLFTEASLGEQRLLLLARALVKFPSLLILDEPCQGLDPIQAKLFVQMLEGLCARMDTTMIYVTHYPDEIPHCVTCHLKLEAGRMVYCGTFIR